MGATLERIRATVVHPLWFDATDEEIGEYLGANAHEVHAIREEPEIVRNVDAQYAEDLVRRRR